MKAIIAILLLALVTEAAAHYYGGYGGYGKGKGKGGKGKKGGYGGYNRWKKGGGKMNKWKRWNKYWNPPTPPTGDGRGTPAPCPPIVTPPGPPNGGCPQGEFPGCGQCWPEHDEAMACVEGCPQRRPYEGCDQCFTTEEDALACDSPGGPNGESLKKFMN